jgi:phage FluMu protein Com
MHSFIKEKRVATNNSQLRQIRCSNCGRFLGIGHIEEGEIYLKCKNCKVFTVVLGKTAEKNLTGKEMYERIVSTGQKVRKVQVPT